MSRSTLRQGITAYFDENTLLGKVYRSFPKIVDPKEYMQLGVPTGCYAVIHLANEQERRVAFGGATSGEKRVDTSVEIHLFCTSVQPDMQDAMDDFDGIVESVKEWIRKDRTLGGAVWQAGEDMAGRYSEPVLNEQTTDIWGVIAFTVTEWLVGT